MSEEKKIPTKQFLVWIEGDDENPGYFEMFDSIEDIISMYGSEKEIYRADIKPIGRYKKQTKIIKIKSRKKRVIK